MNFNIGDVFPLNELRIFDFDMYGSYKHPKLLPFLEYDPSCFAGDVVFIGSYPIFIVDIEEFEPSSLLKSGDWRSNSVAGTWI